MHLQLQKIIHDRSLGLDDPGEPLCYVLPVVAREILVRDLPDLKFGADVFHCPVLLVHMISHVAICKGTNLI